MDGSILGQVVCVCLVYVCTCTLHVLGWERGDRSVSNRCNGKCDGLESRKLMMCLKHFEVLTRVGKMQFGKWIEQS